MRYQTHLSVVALEEGSPAPAAGEGVDEAVTKHRYISEFRLRRKEEMRGKNHHSLHLLCLILSPSCYNCIASAQLSSPPHPLKCQTTPATTVHLKL